MVLNFSSDELAEAIWVDRDGVQKDHGRQGFSVCLAGLELHFDDEADAERLAEMILERNGVQRCP